MMSVIALRFFCCLFTFLVVVRCAHPSAILQDRMNSHNHMRRHVADGNGPCVTFSRVGELGRLGNQIFQVASTIGVAEKRDLCWFFTGRITDSSVSRLFDIPARSGTFEGLLIVHVEERQDFYEVTLPELQHGKHHDLYGYFQSPEYFEYSRATLASIFRPRPSLVNEVEATTRRETPKHRGHSCATRRLCASQSVQPTERAILSGSVISHRRRDLCHSCIRRHKLVQDKYGACSLCAWIHNGSIFTVRR